MFRTAFYFCFWYNYTCLCLDPLTLTTKKFGDCKPEIKLQFYLGFDLWNWEIYINSLLCNKIYTQYKRKINF